ncbi:MAG: 50S ribosomal protein L18 [Parcubacteria group bacterium GW2011_GWD2_38_12]|uniref:Large ribosomal subunit protein uL18 n=1 Tax=Candidatus Azambacteria bacterium RIFCSPLOWO2_01_FULL_37_9 TaxID=1797297 RepID=A0A1F5C6G8_9BACT|nr:MAG: 50S ribosomal protein L18 [Parcubacteria group bacterium GW2011_GWC2_36_17]KKQ39100.1 MAG: 50S ribosomal protein L18 [Candidatus Moranbacteria bacterium GW2011_GWF2_37_7]KKQ52177.1 MAG: 50S ribosomal protein L18 [Parcubacteria group bacterium GW2011_GWD2_38_12]KKQ58228.1 MAG: 50S ribosomal protein L18 [Parcubacteria group bacterium GW2011_GWD1_38_16]KKQ58903.1 MAG: 50S ribosomal protein L18 [Parcubacteria group bacterium GW2011_GWC1_38_17]OGD38415.1 MAG: 50S ribosomal protein L18 [Cand
MQKKISKIKIANKLARKKRIRARISGSSQMPRLSVFKSNQHIYVQVIDDQAGKTLAAASDSEIKSKGTFSEKAKAVGILIAKKAKENNIGKVVFDRGGNKYHGIIKLLADAAREKGLKF